VAQMHVSKGSLAAEAIGGYEARSAELLDYTVAFETVKAGFPPGGQEMFRGLPDDACQSPHWGYLFKGRFRAPLTTGGEVVVSAGEAYYLPPGHRYEALEDCETVEFSPTNELVRSLAVVAKNMAARGDTTQ